MTPYDYIPVKLGDIVYTIDEGTYDSNWKPFVQPKVVAEINNKYGRQGKELGWGVILHGPSGNNRYAFSKLYKSWWINKEDAEAGNSITIKKGFKDGIEIIFSDCDNFRHKASFFTYDEIKSLDVNFSHIIEQLYDVFLHDLGA